MALNSASGISSRELIGKDYENFPCPASTDTWGIYRSEPPPETGSRLAMGDTRLPVFGQVFRTSHAPATADLRAQAGRFAVIDDVTATVYLCHQPVARLQARIAAAVDAGAGVRRLES